MHRTTQYIGCQPPDSLRFPILNDPLDLPIDGLGVAVVQRQQGASLLSFFSYRQRGGVDQGERYDDPREKELDRFHERPSKHTAHGGGAARRPAPDPARERELIRRLRELVAELRYLGLKDSEIIALMDESGVGQ